MLHAPSKVEYLSAETAAVESLLWHGQCAAPLSYFFVTLIWKPLVLGDFDLS